jgi:hypothetical protein
MKPNGDFEGADRLLRSRGIPRSTVFCSQSSSDSVRVLGRIIVVKVVQPMEANWLWSKHLPEMLQLVPFCARTILSSWP